ncbi:MAG: MurR/RpiR family transcriptional regulator, partial [Streptococcaceae bacterium]|nr:MurR/RpiR family transcriptional regulator [Streptococcaceae bacterium]
MAFFQNIKMETLSEVDKTIYNYLSGNIDKVPYLRVRDVAHEAHTSPSSVMRFIKHIGYESFPEFRLAFREETVTLPDELMGERILSKDNFPADLDERLAKVAQMIINCENIVFFGVGMSAYTCETAARLFAMLGFNTTPYTDNTYPVFQKLNDTSDNIFIALSVTGNTSEVVEIMNGVK